MAAHQAPRPWDSAGKNTGVGCHFLLQCMKVKSESEIAQLCQTLNDPMDCSLPGSSVGVVCRRYQFILMAQRGKEEPVPHPPALIKESQGKNSGCIHSLSCDSHPPPPRSLNLPLAAVFQFMAIQFEDVIY